MGSCPGPGSLPSSICHVGQRKLWPWHFRPQTPRLRHPQNKEEAPHGPRGSPGTARSCSPGGNSMEDEVGAGVWGALKSRSCSRLRHSRRCLHLGFGAPSSSSRTARALRMQPHPQGKRGFLWIGVDLDPTWWRGKCLGTTLIPVARSCIALLWIPEGFLWSWILRHWQARFQMGHPQVGESPHLCSW